MIKAGVVNVQAIVPKFRTPFAMHTVLNQMAVHGFVTI